MLTFSHILPLTYALVRIFKCKRFVFPYPGRFLTSAAFDCATHQAECNKLGVFLKGLPKDVVVLLAAQGPSVVAGHVLPTTELKKIGANHAENVSAQTRHAVIGYKGQMKGVTWIKEILSDKGSAEVSSSIPIRFSYKPKGKGMTAFFFFFSCLGAWCFCVINCT